MRKNAKTTAGGRAADVSALRARAARARARHVGRAADERAHRVLEAYLDAMTRQGRAAGDVIADMARGEAAWQIGMALRDELMRAPPEAVRQAACGAGCAFCCILRGGDGGTITEAEATRLHAALAPLAGAADGRQWHPEACPALDPASRTCRAYEARPMICRSFLSTDAGACEVNASGAEIAGAGLLGTHLDYLAVHALVRDTLKGIVRVATYSLARVAEGAVMGEPLAASLEAARHPSRALEDACRDAAHASSPG